MFTIWLVGFVVLAVAFLLAPLSEAARSVATPGRHSGRGVRVFNGRDTSPFQAPSVRRSSLWWHARPVSARQR